MTRRAFSSEIFMYVKRKKREWFYILRDLMAAGVPMNKVASACNKTGGTVAHWANGGEPKDSDARIVLALYKRFCPKNYEEHSRQFDIDQQEVTDGA